jgi:hypothetical protein
MTGFVILKQYAIFLFQGLQSDRVFAHNGVRHRRADTKRSRKFSGHYEYPIFGRFPHIGKEESSNETLISIRESQKETECCTTKSAFQFLLWFWWQQLPQMALMRRVAHQMTGNNESNSKGERVRINSGMKVIYGSLLTGVLILSACSPPTPPPPPKRTLLEDVQERNRAARQQELAEAIARIRQAAEASDAGEAVPNAGDTIERISGVGNRTPVFRFPCSAQVGPDRDDNGLPDHCQGYIGESDTDRDGTPNWRDTCEGDDCDNDGVPERWDSDPNESYIVKQQREAQRFESIRREKARLEAVRIEKNRQSQDQDRRDQLRRDQARRDQARRDQERWDQQRRGRQ